MKIHGFCRILHQDRKVTQHQHQHQLKTARAILSDNRPEQTGQQ
jgi:hypothetical protein